MCTPGPLGNGVHGLIGMWAIDISASVNLVNSKPTGAICKYTASNVKLDNVNGPAESTLAADLGVPGIPQVMSAVVMDDTPNCKSAGRMVLDHGYGLRWSEHAAGLNRPGGSKAELMVRVYLTYLPKQEELHRCVAAGAADTVGQIEATLKGLPVVERHKLVDEFTQVYGGFLDVWCDYKGVGSGGRRRLKQEGPIRSVNAGEGVASSRSGAKNVGGGPAKG